MEQNNKNDLEQNKNKEKKKITLNPHFIILGVILIVALTAGFKLIRWNIGEKSDYDPTEDTSQFDTENEDYIMVTDPLLLEGRPDDGVTTVLSLGNEPFASDRGKTGIASQLETISGSVVYNASFGNTYMSCKNTAYNEDYVNDAFSLYWLTKAITLQDFTLQDNSLSDFAGEDPQAKETLDLLKSVDMDKVDVLTILYDANDYLDVRITNSPYDATDIGTTSGALSQALTMFQETYPHIRIIVLSVPFACAIDDNGEYQLGSTYRTQVGLLSDYMTAAKFISVEQSVSFLDNYFGSITESNYKEYLEDNINLNAKGRKLIAERIAAVL